MLWPRCWSWSMCRSQGNPRYPWGMVVVPIKRRDHSKQIKEGGCGLAQSGNDQHAHAEFPALVGT